MGGLLSFQEFPWAITRGCYEEELRNLPGPRVRSRLEEDGWGRPGLTVSSTVLPIRSLSTNKGNGCLERRPIRSGIRPLTCIDIGHYLSVNEQVVAGVVPCNQMRKSKD